MPQTGNGGWGYVIRDNSGSVIVAEAAQILYLIDAFHAETIAVKAGIDAAAKKGIVQVELETDSMMLMYAMTMRGAKYSLAATGGLLHEINCSLRTYLVLSNVNHCPGSCNKVTYDLAAYGCSCPQLTSLVRDGIPPGLAILSHQWYNGIRYSSKKGI